MPPGERRSDVGPAARQRRPSPLFVLLPLFVLTLALRVHRGADLVDLDPLLGCQHQMHAVNHHRARRVVFGAQLLDFLDLLRDARDVAVLSLMVLVSASSSFSSSCHFSRSFGAVGFPDLVDFLGLLVGEAQLFAACQGAATTSTAADRLGRGGICASAPRLRCWSPRCWSHSGAALAPAEQRNVSRKTRAKCLVMRVVFSGRCSLQAVIRPSGAMFTVYSHPAAPGAAIVGVSVND